MIPTDVRIKENELYQEVELFIGDTKVGEAEIEVTKRMLSRFVIYEPYQNKGYGTRILNELMRMYMLTNLWVEADNDRAIHVYEKFGFKKVEPTMYKMEVNADEDSD
jgi:RimJ/RimL family protein N-acetyltransferase